jgi:hypothetical protein
VPLWRHVEGKSEATQSRWQWTWAVDDSVFHKYGEQLGLVGHWWSGQQHRVLSRIRIPTPFFCPALLPLSPWRQLGSRVPRSRDTMPGAKAPGLL